MQLTMEKAFCSYQLQGNPPLITPEALLLKFNDRTSTCDVEHR